MKKLIFMVMMVGIMGLSFAQAERDVQIIENEIGEKLLGSDLRITNFKLR